MNASSIWPLDKMIRQERRIFIGANPFEPFEPFDHYLSAFLSAARTVDYRLRHEQAAIYPDWRKAWDASLTPQENSLIKFMVDDRNDEVHESGSSRSEAGKGSALSASAECRLWLLTSEHSISL